jgi:L-threonylcarbamoyladenylate synthase
VTIVQPVSDAALEHAAYLVRGGGLIAFPTETFYAIGALPLDDCAVRRVFGLKKRTADTPIPVLIRNRQDLENLVSEITPTAKLLMDACWPGPLTLVFRASDAVPAVLTGGTGTIGIRLARSSIVRRLLKAVGGPLTGTSANRTGSPPAATAQEVQQIFGLELEFILDGGSTLGDLPSTVLDTTVMPARLLREGAVDRSALLSLLGTLAPCEQKAPDVPIYNGSSPRSEPVS